MKRISTLLFVQGLYTLVTAAWPLLDIKSFMVVTGYKEDVWLVKTVAAILLAMSVSFFSAINSKDKNVPIFLLGCCSSIALAFVDFYYSLTNVISDIYQLDGTMQLMSLFCWAVALITLIKKRQIQ